MRISRVTVCQPLKTTLLLPSDQLHLPTYPRAFQLTSTFQCHTLVPHFISDTTPQCPRSSVLHSVLILRLDLTHRQFDSRKGFIQTLKKSV
ncbi:uncharacterized protein YALI1_C11365g [Yarrowia lipolytica]|uniref:Uncharacterized protein n=1 Tax=Yarrowia lipolytica TaxID=4952 RepID=A0A1D8NA60_YARLL|nr:hypothetical protein YALI1_C11365g [Yarrowia lipolytica]